MKHPDGTTFWVPIESLVGMEGCLGGTTSTTTVTTTTTVSIDPYPTDYVLSGCQRTGEIVQDVITNDKSMTLGKCFMHCRDNLAMKYFAVTEGKTCSCAPHVPGELVSSD